jgi:hypothetical protein
MDDLRYFSDEKTFKRGGAPKGIASLDSFFVSRESYGKEANKPAGGVVSSIATGSGSGSSSRNKDITIGFTVHASPLPFLFRTEDPAVTEAWIKALADFAYSGASLSTRSDVPVALPPPPPPELRVTFVAGLKESVSGIAALVTKGKGGSGGRRGTVMPRFGAGSSAAGDDDDDEDDEEDDYSRRMSKMDQSDL